MKKFVVLILIIMFSITGCSKDGSDTENTKYSVEEIETLLKECYTGFFAFPYIEEKDGFMKMEFYRDEQLTDIAFSVTVDLNTGKIEEEPLMFKVNSIEEAEKMRDQKNEIASDEEETEDSVNIQENFDQVETQPLQILEGKDFSDDVALILRMDDSGEEIISVIDKKGKVLFDLSQLDQDTYLQNVSSFHNGSIECKDEILDKEGNVIFNWKDKYDSLYNIGNGFYLVSIEPEGYMQENMRCGIIDGKGNEIIPATEEMAQIFAPNGKLNYSEIGFKKDGILAMNNAVVDANDRVITYLEGYKNDGNGSSPFLSKRQNAIITIWGEIYNLDGSLRTTLDIEHATQLVVSENVILNFDEDSNIKGTIMKIFDFQGTLLSQKNMENCIIDTITKFEDGKAACYIKGADGYYATMINENGEFLFEPIKCYDDIVQRYTDVSEGLLKISFDESTTKFLNDKGVSIITIDTKSEDVGNCINGYIYVKNEGSCYYTNKDYEKIH